MTVLTVSKLMYPDQSNPAQVGRFILPKNNGAYTDTDVKNVIQYYFDTCKPLLVDPVLAIAQMCVETAYMSSYWAARPRCNPAGIGVTGEPNAGVSFGSWHSSVPAHVGRLVAYAVAPDKRTPAQQAAVTSALAWRTLPLDRQGKAPTLKDLAGFWAADLTYADKITKMANLILSA